MSMVVCRFKSNTWEAEIGGSQLVWGQPGLYSKYQDSQGYVETLFHEKKNRKEKNQNTCEHYEKCPTQNRYSEQQETHNVAVRYDGRRKKTTGRTFYTVKHSKTISSKDKNSRSPLPSA